VLRSFKNGRIYIGQTNDVERRLAEHNSGQTKSTRAKGPYQIVHVEEFNNRIDAIQREQFLKSGKGREELRSLGL
jgi:putative endonuclease